MVSDASGSWGCGAIPTHIRGVENTLADALSRNNAQLFHSLYPQAKAEPCSIPDSLQDVLFIQKPDWMHVPDLDTAVEFFVCNGLAPSTVKMYNSAKRQYLEFCLKRNVSPLPISEELLCEFVASLALERLAHSTIKCYLSGVCHLQIAKKNCDG